MLNVLGVLSMDAGLFAVAVGLITMMKPLHWLAIDSRKSAALVLAAGGLLVLVAIALPAPSMRAAPRPASPLRHIDDLLPEYQFAEHHEILVQAPASRVFWAIKSVPAGEITLFRTLTWLRQPRLSWSKVPESILAPSETKPILEVAAGSGFLLLAEEPESEIVLGSLVIRPRAPLPDSPEEWKALRAPGYAKAILNFVVTPLAGGACRVSTDTRVFATDPATRRRFAAYWRVIYPGSALIRVQWLRAIRRRAEGPGRE